MYYQQPAPYYPNIPTPQQQPPPQQNQHDIRNEGILAGYILKDSLLSFIILAYVGHSYVAAVLTAFSHNLSNITKNSNTCSSSICFTLNQSEFLLARRIHLSVGHFSRHKKIVMAISVDNFIDLTDKFAEVNNF